MMIPGIMAQRRVVSGGGTLWTPLNMATVPQIYLDAQDSVVTDVSGACSAISNLGAMGASGDFSQATAANRPAILAAELNGNKVLSFDGTNDFLAGTTLAQKDIFKGVFSAWCFIVYKKRSIDLTDKNRGLLYTTAGGTTGSRFAMYAGTAVAGGKNKPTIGGRRLDADATALLGSASEVSVSYEMQYGIIDYSTRAGSIYVNGSLAAENLTLVASSGSTNNTSAQEYPVLGTVAGTFGVSDVDIASVITSNVIPSGTDLDRLFGWAAHKYGLTANLPGGHPYKTTPPYV